MKPGQLFALIIGVLFLSAGIMGFIPAFVKEPVAGHGVVDMFDAGFGYLMGIFPINTLHNMVHLSVGLLGLWSSLGLGASRIYCRVLAFFYGLLALMGLLPFANTTFGLIPIFGNDVWLHAGTAALAYYFGFVASPGLLDVVSQQEKDYGYEYHSPTQV